MLKDLLLEKKHFLEEFYRVNILGLKQFSSENFDTIDAFYQNREKILQILQFIDHKINQHELNKTHSPDHEVISFLKLEIRSLTQHILNQDLEILSLVDRAKSSIIKDLQNIQKNKKLVSSYKTKVDHHQIDEEI